jgi:hypothetical protein
MNLLYPSLCNIPQYSIQNQQTHLHFSCSPREYHIPEPAESDEDPLRIQVHKRIVFFSVYTGYVFIYTCIYIYMYVRMYVSMYVCMYACILFMFMFMFKSKSFQHIAVVSPSLACWGHKNSEIIMCLPYVCETHQNFLSKLPILELNNFDFS